MLQAYDDTVWQNNEMRNERDGKLKTVKMKYVDYENVTRSTLKPSGMLEIDWLIAK